MPCPRKKKVITRYGIRNSKFAEGRQDVRRTSGKTVKSSYSPKNGTNNSFN